MVVHILGQANHGKSMSLMRLALSCSLDPLTVPGGVGTSGALHPFFGILCNNTNSSVMGVDAEHTALSSIQPIVSTPDAMDDTSSLSHDSVDAGMYYF